MGTSISLPERPGINEKRSEIVILRKTRTEKGRSRVPLHKLQTGQSLGRLYRLHEPARTEEQTSKIKVELW